MLGKQLRRFLREHAGKGTITVPPALMEEYLNTCKEALENIFTPARQSGNIRVSDLGKDREHLKQVLQGNRPAQKLDYNNYLIFWRGYVFEALTEALLELSGNKPEESQTKLTIEVGTWDDKVTKVNGKLDIVYNSEIIDIKTANDKSYAEKFKSSSTLAGNDSYNYLIQGQAYQEGRGLPFAGWLVVNPNTCQIKDVLIEEHIRPIMKERYEDALHEVREALESL